MGASLLSATVLFVALPLCMGRPPRLLVGTHHKTGTVLMKEMLDILAKPELMNLTVKHNKVPREGDDIEGHVPGSVHIIPYDPIDVSAMAKAEWKEIDVLFDHRVHWREDEMEIMRTKGGGKRKLKFVHLVRHPLDMIASGYVYHKQDPPPSYEPWLSEPLSELLRTPKPWVLEVKSIAGEDHWQGAESYSHLLRRLPLKIGALAEALRSKEDVEEMITALHLEGLHVCLDSFGEDFNATTERILKYWLLSKKERKENKEIENLQELKDAVWPLAHPPRSQHINPGTLEDRAYIQNEVAHYTFMEPLLRSFQLFAPEPCKDREWPLDPNWKGTRHYNPETDEVDEDPYIVPPPSGYDDDDPPTFTHNKPNNDLEKKMTDMLDEL
mmetsp:Transcript_79848/g.151663  ORF Transcript_79848/g.151663 Transcript_79848/m.151663 type:complete len:384 (+) Transcript_79848:83-1234(+)